MCRFGDSLGACLKPRETRGTCPDRSQLTTVSDDCISDDSISEVPWHLSRPQPVARLLLPGLELLRVRLLHRMQLHNIQNILQSAPSKHLTSRSLPEPCAAAKQACAAVNPFPLKLQTSVCSVRLSEVQPSPQYRIHSLTVFTSYKSVCEASVGGAKSGVRAKIPAAM
jgi:hypothetical protein